jgi:peptidoglycan hydrolase CwlO-like protein
MNPTLISGFEDVITHINQQEQRVMGLEEENKKLKAEMEKLEAKILRLQSSEQDLENKLDTGGWSPTSSIEPKQ